MSELTKEFTDQLYANYETNVKYAALENAVTHNGIHASLETRKSAVENTPVFSLDLTKDKVTNQKASGRCWMFAALNTFRHKMISSFQLEDFELSQAHTFFWDKYEKSNWFLEQVIATADQELTSPKRKWEGNHQGNDQEEEGIIQLNSDPSSCLVRRRFPSQEVPRYMGQATDQDIKDQ